MTTEEVGQEIKSLPEDVQQFLMAYAVSEGASSETRPALMQSIVGKELPKSFSGIRTRLKKYAEYHGLSEKGTLMPESVLGQLRQLAVDTPSFASRAFKAMASKNAYRDALHLFEIECNDTHGRLCELSFEERRILAKRKYGIDWIRSRTPRILGMLVELHVGCVLDMCSITENSCDFLDATSGLSIVMPQPVHADLATYMLLRNDRARFAHLLSLDPPEYIKCNALGMQALLAGNAGGAEVFLMESRRHFRKLIQKNTAELPEPQNLALQLARFLTEDNRKLEAMRKECHRYYASYPKQPSCQGYAALWCWDMLRKGTDKALLARTLSNALSNVGNGILARIMFVSAAVRVSMEDAEDMAKTLYGELAPLPLAQKIFYRILKKVPDPLPAASDVLDLSSLVIEKPLWQIRIEQMETMAGAREKAEEKADASTRRLIWLFNPERMELQPQEQSMGKSGKWSAGRNVALKRLKDDAERLEWLTDQDRRLASCIYQNFSYWGNPWMINLAKAIPLLVGHPMVFEPSTRDPWTIVQGELRMQIKTSGNECSLSLPEFEIGSAFILERDGSTLRCCPVTPEMEHMARVLGKGFTFPKSETSRVLDTLGRIGGVPFDTDIEAEERPGDPTPIVQIRQAGTSFPLRIRVRPGGASHPASDPGAGRPEFMTSENGEPVKYLRDFNAEKEAADGLIAACPALAEQCENRQAELDDPETALTVLSELRACPLPHAVEWPEGEKLHLAGNLGARDISIRVRGKGGWFEVGGEAKVDEDLVISMEALLEANARSRGRFIQLDDERFLALTEDLKKKLDRLAAFTTKEHGGRRLNAFAAGGLEEDLEGVGLDSDAEWKQLIRRFAEARALEPRISPLLQADLRPYQQEGVLWMLRLAAMGMGACLADDMGLGKTVQTTAVLLDMAKKGPCLVVAPMSVCANWESELARFAPSLQTVRLGKQDTRAATIQAMGPGMVLIISYSLLHIEQENLSSVHWATVVFDEAQALKNAHTKRARAGGELEADFRVALTGTPIENHVEDLWSLFNTILPGLLGSAESFRNRFGSAQPGSQASTSLRRLIRPFILRRMKSHVIEELPGRTEQTLLIEPSAKEHAFYEALRRRAKKNLADIGKDGASRIQILAALTRLRRACCHPSLADPDAGITADTLGSKTEHLLELAAELKDGGHKMLVFSQFTGHLALIRKALENSGFACLYLDGSTPEKKRAEAVAEFQRGAADAFLISLKAGGLGLNLTAADYVIHMDPWWNPAVEDQASDRACRIGQKKPVTIYRMVMKDTVEEKILELHRRKKDLAADFLEGTDDASLVLTDEDLMSLL